MQNHTRLEGKVKAIGKDNVTVETADHKSHSIKITNATKFLKGNKPSSLSEMKTGDHAVFDVIPSTATASATTATSFTPSAANTMKDSLSLGIGFTAVQASY